MDHKYSLLLDEKPQKLYTNYVIYPSAKVKIITKATWEKLQELFGGIELKRYNVWVTGRPNEIITEIFLKKIKVKKSNSD